MLSVRAAIDSILARSALLPSEQLPLALANGRALAEDVRSARDVPAFRNSAMDGYAVCAADTAGATSRDVVLPVVEVIAAGSVPTRAVTAGTAAMIMTGAMVPDGADAVIRVEDCEALGADRVRLRKTVAAGNNIRLAGEDVRCGDNVFQHGLRLRPADLGVLASLGHATVTVRRRPVVAILATGDELIEPDQPLAAGKVVNSNAYTLAAAVEDAGASARPLGVARDTPDRIRAAFQEALSADVVVSTGGVSMGTFDLVRDTLRELGVGEVFWKIAQKPGKPMTFGVRDQVLVFGLPGNPVSALVCFHLYVAPALRALQGLKAIHAPTATATVVDKLRTTAGLTDFIRCSLTGPLHALEARPTGSQSSGVLRSMSVGDALLVSPPEQQEIAAGEQAPVILLNQMLSGEPAV